MRMNVVFITGTIGFPTGCLGHGVLHVGATRQGLENVPDRTGNIRSGIIERVNQRMDIIGPRHG
jgi:hypothetical protein